jgi:hypothetical protein
VKFVSLKAENFPPAENISLTTTFPTPNAAIPLDLLDPSMKQFKLDSAAGLTGD